MGAMKSAAAPNPLVAEVAARLGVSAQRIELAFAAAERLSDDELKLLENLLELEGTLGEERRRALCRGWAEAVDWCRSDYQDDPFDFDEPLEIRDGVTAMVWADAAGRSNRAAILRDSVAAAEVGRRTGRSRQAIEKQRRAGRLVALRVGRQWRYPLWQFDPDAPGGTLAGLAEVLGRLHLSSAGAALWLTSPQPGLEGLSPVRLLQRRETARVIRLAEQHGYLP